MQEFVLYVYRKSDKTCLLIFHGATQSLVRGMIKRIDHDGEHEWCDDTKTGYCWAEDAATEGVTVPEGTPILEARLADGREIL
jgi:hypothetical protein